MNCVKSAQSYEETIKKSRFIGIITPCESEQMALQALKKVYQQHSNANHIAFAYRIYTSKGMQCRFHDAGEPTGTAGKPIFQHLEGKQLVNVVVAVVRYFGGVKLGAGGLTRAYGNSAKHVIEAAEIIEYVEMETLELVIDYKQTQLLDYHLPKLDAEIVHKDFGEKVKFLIQLPAKNVAVLTSLMS